MKPFFLFVQKLWKNIFSHYKKHMTTRLNIFYLTFFYWIYNTFPVWLREEEFSHTHIGHKKIKDTSAKRTYLFLVDFKALQVRGLQASSNLLSVDFDPSIDLKENETQRAVEEAFCFEANLTLLNIFEEGGVHLSPIVCMAGHNTCIHFEVL